MTMTKSNHNFPKISVVIPAFNESTMLPICLEAIKYQDYEGAVELIVADNASTDSTPEIAKSFGAIVKYEPHPGVVYARIAGFKAATGKIIVSTDADTITPKDWLSQIESKLRSKRYSGVVGAYTLYNTNSPTKKIIKLLIPTCRVIDRLFGAHFTGANFAVYKEAYDKVGGFDSHFQTGEDFDLSYRLRKHGYKLKVAHRICVRTSARRLNEGFWHTFANYIVKNWCSLLFFHHPYLKTLTNVREEPGEIEEVISV